MPVLRTLDISLGEMPTFPQVHPYRDINNDWTQKPVNRGHLTSVIGGHLTSVLTRTDPRASGDLRRRYPVLAARGESPCLGSTRSIPRTTLSRMAMGKRRRRARQASMWIPTSDLPRSAAHPFYRRLNRILDEAGFDAFGEAQCTKFYAPVLGRPSLAPGRYVRLLLLGYFEGLDSERAIAWRAADSLSVRAFLHLELADPAPDHSTISRTRRLIDLETHTAVFTWILQQLADAGLVKGQTVGSDATTLEANAALRSIVRRDTGESYEVPWCTTPLRAESLP